MTSPGPAHVLIIRHGEKLGDESNDDDGGPNLSLAGSGRAAALPLLFAPQQPSVDCALSLTGAHVSTAEYAHVDVKGGAPPFDAPDFVFATRASSKSNRPVETITPLLAALGLTCNDKHSDQDFGTVADDIRQNPKYAGKNVLVCWHHGKIPDLAGALGVANPPPWPGATVFDRVWQIVYEDGTAALTDLPQKLLYADSSS